MANIPQLLPIGTYKCQGVSSKSNANTFEYFTSKGIAVTPNSQLQQSGQITCYRELIFNNGLQVSYFSHQGTSGCLIEVLEPQELKNSKVSYNPSQSTSSKELKKQCEKLLLEKIQTTFSSKTSVNTFKESEKTHFLKQKLQETKKELEASRKQVQDLTDETIRLRNEMDLALTQMACKTRQQVDLIYSHQTH